MLEDIKRENGASDSVVAEATRKTNTLNVQRNELISSIDEAFNKIAGGQHVATTAQNTKVYAGASNANAKCGSCRENDAEQLRTCPCSEEINNDDKGCNCCNECREECAMGI